MWTVLAGAGSAPPLREGRSVVLCDRFRRRNMEIQEVLPTHRVLIPTGMGNIYRSSFSLASAAKRHGKVRRNFGLHSLPSQNSSRSVSHQSQDFGSMTIEFLRARLLAERSTAKLAKQKVEELQMKVRELERALAFEVDRRKQAEAALQESLEKLLECQESNSGGSSTDTDAELESLSRTLMSDDASRHSQHEEELMTPASSRHHSFSGKLNPHSRDVSDDNDKQSSRRSAQQQAENGILGNEAQVSCEQRKRENIAGSASFVKAEAGELTQRVDDRTVQHIPSTSAATSPEILDGSDEDLKGKTLMGSRLYLTQVDLVRKIGRSTHTVRRKPRKPKPNNRSQIEQEVLAELSGWVNHVVSMLEARAAAAIASRQRLHALDHRNKARKATLASGKQEQQGDKSSRSSMELRNEQRKRSGNSGRSLPYISFAKYLGSGNLGKLLEEVKTSTEGANLMWRIRSFCDGRTVQSGSYSKLGEISQVNEAPVFLPSLRDVHKEEKKAEEIITEQLQDGDVEQRSKTEGCNMEVSEAGDYICMDIVNYGKKKEVQEQRTSSSPQVKCQSKLLGKLGTCFSASSSEVHSDEEKKKLSVPETSAVEKQAAATAAAAGAGAAIDVNQQSTDKKIEEIFKALNTAKQQLRSSIERRQMIEDQLRSSASACSAGRMV